MALFVYNLVFILALPLVYIRMQLKALKQPDYGKRWHERMALVKLRVPADGVLFHVASLGEAIAASAVIQRFMQIHSDVAITITCMTPTGSAYIQKTFGDRVHHCYLPYDIALLQWWFLSRVRPRVVVLMETELWPNLLRCAKQRGIRTLLINGRLSARSAKGYAKVPAITQGMLRDLDCIGAQFKSDAQRFTELGCDAKKLMVTGNVKFDVSLSPRQSELNKALRDQWQLNRPVWLAASTHHGEERKILKAHQKLLEQIPNALLILVPRHPQRFDAITIQCAEHFICEKKTAIRTAPNSDTQVLIGNTMGEMMQYMSLADVVFMGGSLVERGGHNPFEAACQKKPIIAGKHVFNFEDSYRLLSEYNALIMLDGEKNLSTSVSSLLLQPSKRKQLGDNALLCQQASRGATVETLKLIQQQYQIASQSASLLPVALANTAL
ncbi:lipid IV(A) 3-deoxy-D-manno-octulosonic acid transferase [Alteromonadaceae bacterium BrNp21-10]|nr:lipid IV(A) 3-deoxy-D-manno-octulosonic acid transferase [Alteromonadaceae bacterium BrNp21-10]